MSSAKVLVTVRIPEHILARLAKECSLSFPVSDYPVPRQELLDLVPGIQALFCTSDDKVDKELLDKAGKQLKVNQVLNIIKTPA